MDVAIERIDQALAESRAVTQLLVYLAESATEEERRMVRPAVIAILWQMLDWLQAALDELSRLAMKRASNLPPARPA